MREVCTWHSKAGSDGRIEHRVREAKFGDGYSQAIPDGLNTRVETWTRVFEGNAQEIEEICDFFDRHMGATPFLWASPRSFNGELKLFRVRSYSMNRNGALYSVTAEFVQDFRP